MGEGQRRIDEELDDVAGILEMQSTRLDRQYIERWARELGVLDLWERVSGQASPEGEA